VTWKPRLGFEWLAADAEDGIAPGLWLTPRGRRLERVELEDPLLCRRFAELDADDRDAVLAFANAHGWLATGLREIPPHLGTHASEEVDDGDQVSVGAQLAEPLEAWRVEVRRMRDLLALHDAAESGSRSLRAWIVETHDARSYRPRPGEHVAWVGAKGELWKLATRGHRAAARALVAEMVRESLRPPADARLAELVPRTGAELAYTGEGSAFTLRAVAHSLAGALWLQAAALVTGELAQHRCDSCGRWFEASRSHARFCPDRPACRQAATSERKRKAIRLRRAGVRSEAEIARRVGAKDAATVRGWLRAAPAAPKRRKR
jgi:hypothetical protein